MFTQGTQAIRGRENTLKWMVALSNPTLQPAKTIFEQIRVSLEVQINYVTKDKCDVNLQNGKPS